MKTSLKCLLFAGMALGLAACDGLPARTREVLIVDQELRAALFDQCLKNLPAGPQRTQYNDWDEVITACGNQAYYAAQRTIDKDTPMRPSWRRL